MVLIAAAGLGGLSRACMAELASCEPPWCTCVESGDPIGGIAHKYTHVHGILLVFLKIESALDSWPTGHLAARLDGRERFAYFGFTWILLSRASCTMRGRLLGYMMFQLTVLLKKVLARPSS